MTSGSDFPKLTNETKSGGETESEIFRIRVRKEDSAYVYALFEAHEGVAAYTTLENRPGDRHRDLEFIVPRTQKAELMRILEDLKEELHGELYYLTLEP